MGRTNIKLDDDLAEALKERKGKYQTWDGFVAEDVLPALDEEADA
jgi:hypothetical protein